MTEKTLPANVMDDFLYDKPENSDSNDGEEADLPK